MSSAEFSTSQLKNVDWRATALLVIARGLCAATTLALFVLFAAGSLPGSFQRASAFFFEYIVSFYVIIALYFPLVGIKKFIERNFTGTIGWAFSLSIVVMLLVISVTVIAGDRHREVIPPRATAAGYGAPIASPEVPAAREEWWRNHLAALDCVAC